MRFSKSSVAALAAAAPLATAQTFTDCNPLDKTCPNDTGLNNAAFTTDFTAGSSPSWSTAAYTTIKYGSDGAEFTISQAKQAPTIQTDFYIFFGKIDIKMKAAKGMGIVSSIVLESDDLDEIDWEFLGGNTKEVETNFFGKGNTSSYDRAVYYPVADPQDDYHTYTIDWNSDRLMWIIDGTTVRTLSYDDPLTNGGENYPQTPMRLKMGNWCGGCAGEPKGTVQWAGGATTFDDAPYTMYVESVDIQNSNPADSYQWGDKSGSWQSINIIKGGDSSDPSGHGDGSATSSIAANQTVAPTQSISVSQVHPTGAAVSKTVSGKSYSMNTASASAQNNGGGSGSGSGSGNGQQGGGATSVVMATTEVPGSSPTGGSGIGGSDSGSGSGGSGSDSGSGSGASASASGVAATGGASVNGVMVSTALVGLFFSLLLL